MNTFVLDELNTVNGFEDILMDNAKIQPQLNSLLLQFVLQLFVIDLNRNINFINYIARVIPDPEEMLENRFENLKTYLYAYG
jgi:chaperonin cofactor prefoldin